MKTIIPINVDRNVSFSDYKGLEENDFLLVTQVFYTLQGEGPLTGHPAVFVRLAGCNLGAKEDCPFCDTKFDFDKGKPYTFEQLTDEIETKAVLRARLIVVTGGEPLLQQKALGRFMDYFHQSMNGSKDFRFQIETNGYFVREETFRNVSWTGTYPLIVISPKVAATTGKYARQRSEWFSYHPMEPDQPMFTTALKYVLSADPESPYHTVPEVVVQSARVTQTPLYVSPMAVYLKSYPEGRISSIWHTDEIDQEATAANYRYAGQYAMEKGLLLSIQSHLMVAIE